MNINNYLEILDKRISTETDLTERKRLWQLYSSIERNIHSRYIALEDEIDTAIEKIFGIKVK